VLPPQQLEAAGVEQQADEEVCDGVVDCVVLMGCSQVD
jgi:hypothetical protein